MAEPAKKLEDDSLPGNADSPTPYTNGDEGQGSNQTNDPSEGLVDAESSPRAKSDEGQGDTDPEEKEYNRLRGVVGDKWQSAKHADGDSFWREGKNSKGILGKIRQRRRNMIALGVGGAVLIAAIIGLFGFLNVFKLDHILQNIDAQSFARLNGVEDRRSFYWMRAYMIARMGEIETPGDSAHPEERRNIFFRAEKVGDSPFENWFKTMRTSNFEQDVFEKNGIKFTSVAVPNENGLGYRIRPGLITLNDTPIRINPTGIDYDKIASGNVAEINKFQQGFDAEVFDSNKSARQEIKKVVQDNTRFYQLMKRRMLRKSIQDMTGVKSWRFFETTRDKFDEKKIDIRNKILAKSIPENTASGKFMRCLFGISDCRKSDDINDPQNKASTTEITSTDKPGADEVTTKDASGKPTKEKFDPNEIFSKILGKAGVSTLFSAANVAGTMDMLAKIDANIHNGSLSKMVTVARGTQAVGLYTTFEIARDQMRSGQLTSAETNQFMQVIGNASSSEGWSAFMNNDVPAPKVASSSVIGGVGQWLAKPAYADSSDPSDGSTRSKFCSQEHQAWVQRPENKAAANQEYQYICADKQIGGKNGGDLLEKSYDTSIGIVVHPIANVINGADGVPILGDIFKGLVSISSFFGKISSSIVSGIAKIAGVDDDIAKFGSWIGKQIAGFMGAGPIMNGQEPAGQYTNWIVQGASYAAESTARQRGAIPTTPASANAALMAVNDMNSDESSSLYDKYFAINSPHSQISKILFSVSEQPNNIGSLALSGLGSVFRNFGTLLSSPLGGHAKAETNSDHYKPAAIAGIQTYDFPAQCLDADPLLPSQPKDGTNIQTVLGKDKVPDSDLTWDLVDNSDDFYSYVYDKIGDNPDADEIAKKIYNCNLLDTSVRGGLGALHGYTKDDGYQENAIPADTSTITSGDTSSVGVVGNIGDSSDSLSCAPGTDDLGVANSLYDDTSITKSPGKLKIRLCQIPLIAGQGNDPSGNATSGGAVVNSRVSGAWQALAEQAKADGLKLQANSSFRLANSCGGTGDGSACARPGKSPHQLGVAIDFGNGLYGNKGSSTTSCSGRARLPGNTVWKWLDDNAEKYGIKQYTYEAWHWDLLPLANRCGKGR